MRLVKSFCKIWHKLRFTEAGLEWERIHSKWKNYISINKSPAGLIGDYRFLLDFFFFLNKINHSMRSASLDSMLEDRRA